MNRTTAARPLGVVGSLILAGSGSGPVFVYILYKRGIAELPNRAEHAEYMIMLSNRSDGLDGLKHCRREVNISNEGKCLVEFFSRPPSAGYRLQFRRICMKTGPEYL